MISERKRADAATPAPAKEQRHALYPGPVRLSSEIGEILISLAARIAGTQAWGTFERVLREYHGGTGL